MNGHLTPDDLNAMLPGSRVEDHDGDIWTKENVGNWSFSVYEESSEGLVKECGPIKPVDANLAVFAEKSLKMPTTFGDVTLLLMSDGSVRWLS